MLFLLPVFQNRLSCYSAHLAMLATRPYSYRGKFFFEFTSTIFLLFQFGFAEGPFFVASQSLMLIVYSPSCFYWNLSVNYSIFNNCSLVIVPNFVCNGNFSHHCYSVLPRCKLSGITVSCPTKGSSVLLGLFIPANYLLILDKTIEIRSSPDIPIRQYDPFVMR